MHVPCDKTLALITSLKYFFHYYFICLRGEFKEEQKITVDVKAYI